MTLKILGKAIDHRTGTNVIYAQIPIGEYLSLIGTDFEQFEIQRKKEKHRAYDRLKTDIKEGALLPPITLALKADVIDSVIQLLNEPNGTDALAAALSTPNQAQILDGLQRTYVLSELAAEGFQFRPDQLIMLEFWLEKQLRKLIYRIIVLNAGRKPMSMRHQVELLFLVIKGLVEQQIPGLELYQERDQTRRRGPKKYALDRVAMSYQCFLLKSHEVQKESIVAQELAEGEILDSTEGVLDEKFQLFKKYLEQYSLLDEAGCVLDAAEQAANGIPTGAAWFGSETTLCSFFAALSDFGTTPDRQRRINDALRRMIETISTATPGTDPLGLQTLSDIVKGFNARRINIGAATRRLYFTAFKEYFREEGEKSMKDCWLAAAD